MGMNKKVLQIYTGNPGDVPLTCANFFISIFSAAHRLIFLCVTIFQAALFPAHFSPSIRSPPCIS